MTTTAHAARPPTPFKELDFFVEGDAQMFAGRERETRQLVSRIISSRAIVVHARSGLGKTSLLRAGVMPLLRQQGLRPVYVRTLDSLLGDLADAVVKDCELESTPSDGDPEARVRHVIQAAATGRSLVLMLDQFEEFFTRFERKPRDRQAFVQLITDIVRDDAIDVRVVFSLREDYLYALDEFQRKLPDLFAQAFRLLPLTPLGAREAITRPLVTQTVPYDEALITQLVDELTGFDFDSARLQVTCSEIYRHAQAGANGSDVVALKTDDLNSLKESAGTALTGIYKRYLRAAVGNIPAELRLDAKLLLDKLISANRTKFAMSREALHEEFDASVLVDPVLDVMQEQKLVRCEIRGGKQWFELRHECLVPGILEWFKEDDTFASFRFVRGLIQENSQDGYFRTHPEMLLTLSQLSALTPLEGRLRLTPEQLEYVLYSAVYAHSPDIKIWVQRQPVDTTDALLSTLIHSQNPQAVLGAVIAIGRVGTQRRNLVQDILRPAFDDRTPEELQSAALKSAVRVVSEADLQGIKTRVRLVGTPPRVREFIAALYEAGRMRAGYGVLQRWLTVRYIIRRRSQQYATQRADFISRGILGGILGGLACTLAAVAVLLSHVLKYPRSPSGNEVLQVLGVSGAAVGAALIDGWRNGAASYRTCLAGKTRWRRAAAPSVIIGATPRSSFLIGMLFAILSIYTLCWLAIRAILTLMVAGTELVIRKGRGPKERMLAAAFVCLTPAIIASVVAFEASSDDVRTVLGFIVAALCLLNIELCSFIVAFPDSGIPGIQPLEGPFRPGASKR